MNERKIVLGKEYTDEITGFTGTAIGITRWLTGCTTVALQPKASRNGSLPAEQWFDVTRLEGVRVEQDPGGPHDAPPDPGRQAGG